jgi:hypothetical protein
MSPLAPEIEKPRPKVEDPHRALAIPRGVYVTVCESKGVRESIPAGNAGSAELVRGTLPPQRPPVEEPSAPKLQSLPYSTRVGSHDSVNRRVVTRAAEEPGANVDFIELVVASLQIDLAMWTRQLYSQLDFAE